MFYRYGDFGVLEKDKEKEKKNRESEFFKVFYLLMLSVFVQF